MKTFIAGRGLGILVLALLLLAGPASARPWYHYTTQEIKEIQEAEIATEAFYFSFKKDRSRFAVKHPEWKAPPAVEQALDAMLKRPVWRDPDAGDLNEAQVWQAPAGVLYQFFTCFHRTPFNPKGELAASPPPQIVAGYSDIAGWFRMDVERLVRARLQGSMGGRGGAVIADFQAITGQLDIAAKSVAAHDTTPYFNAVLAAARLTNTAYKTLYSDRVGTMGRNPRN